MLHTAQDVTQNIHSEMVEEVRILVTFQRAQERLKEVLEMSAQDTTRVIRSLKERNWHVSGKYRRIHKWKRINASDIPQQEVLIFFHKTSNFYKILSLLCKPSIKKWL